jgi:hypothetical protein
MLNGLLHRSRRDVLFVCSSSIDEVWIRTTALCCRAAGLKVEVAICGGRSDEGAALLAPYHELGIPARAGVSFGAAAQIPCAIAVTASAGLDRRIFPTRALYFLHMPHSLASLHMIYPADAFDGYEILLAAGPHHEAEFPAIAAARGLPGRRVLAAGYGKLDVLSQRAAQRCARPNGPPLVLMAPSWGPDNLLDRCGIPLAKLLADRGFEVVIRPHPLYFLDRAPVLDAVRDLAGRQPRVRLESPYGGDEAIFDADVLVGDYSGIGFEFAALRRRPVVSVDVGLKVANPHWQSLGIEPVEVACRPLLGPVVAPEVGAIADAVQACIGTARPLPDETVTRFLHGRPGDCGVQATGIIRQLLEAE